MEDNREERERKKKGIRARKETDFCRFARVGSVHDSTGANLSVFALGERKRGFFLFLFFLVMKRHISFIGYERVEGH